MKKIPMKALYTSAKTYAVKHSPDILTGLGIGGFFTAIVATAKAAPKVRDSIEEMEYLADKYGDPRPDMKAKAKVYIRYYWPTALSAGLSTACIITGNRKNAKRNAALAAAYTLSETTLKEYQQSVLETVDETTATEIREKVAKKKVEKVPLTNDTLAIPYSGKGVLCFDKYSGRYFYSDREEIRRVCNDLSRQLLSDMFVTLNEFYDMINLDEIPMGSQVGWNIDDSMIEPYFSSQVTDTGIPCLVIDFTTEPTLAKR